MNPRHIMYLVGQYPSLTETFIEREICGLRERGFVISVCGVNALRVREGFWSVWKEMRSSRRFWRELCKGGCVGRKARAGAIVRAAGLVGKCRNVEHIHAHFLGMPAMTAFCLSSFTGIPYSLTAHARDIYAMETPFRVLEAAAFRTTCTEGNRRHLANKYPGSPFQLIRHGLAAPREFPGQCLKKDVFSIVGIGRFVEKKGFRYLIEACGLLRDKGAAFRCTIVGEGSEGAMLAAQVAAHGLTNYVRLCPPIPRDEVPAMLRAADVLVVPSVEAADGDRDGIPNVLLESMAVGTPVAATDAGSISEAVRHEATGLLCDQRNPEQLAAAIVCLMENPRLAGDLAARARVMLADEFDPDVWTERLIGLFCAGPEYG